MSKGSNTEVSHGSKEILKRSSNELRKLKKEMDSQKLEKDDLRYEVFT